MDNLQQKLLANNAAENRQYETISQIPLEVDMK